MVSFYELPEKKYVEIFDYSGHPDQQALAKQAMMQSMKSSRYFKLALSAACQSDDVYGADMQSFKLPEGIPFEWPSYDYRCNSSNRGRFKRNIDM